MALNETAPLQITIHPPAIGGAAKTAFWSEDAPSFADVFNTINPLQHIPIVSTIYQSVTGDIPSIGAKLAGSALFGGPIGFVASLFDTILENATGGGMVENMMAAIGGEPVPAFQGAEIADNAERHLSPNQRGAYNAYVRAGMLA